MNKGEFLIEKTIKLYESKTGWGDSCDWTNQDFIVLSEKIRQRTGEALSHVTLKRVWGKVKYDSQPNTHTLNTLVQFLDYESWRHFRSQNINGAAKAIAVEQTDWDSRGIVIAGNKPQVKKKVWLLRALGLLQSLWF